LARRQTQIATRFGRSFIVATVAAKVRGLDITCGWFGHASKNWGFSTHLALDLVLLGAFLFLGRTRPVDGRQIS
jgi:hypothetical protein